MAQKVLFVANTGWYLYNFRLPLARHLRELGMEVVFVSPPDEYIPRLQAEGFRWREFALDRRSLNPFKEWMTLGRLVRLYRSERPEVCHHFTIKCVLYGTLAAKLAGVRSVVNAVTGLGHAFIGNGWLHRVSRPLLRFVYRKILTARRVQVVFQNGDDYAEFLERSLILPQKTTIIRGSGVNLQRFRPRPGNLDGQPAPMVLFASRLIREKGIEEFVEAARQLKLRGVQAQFAVAGRPDPGNPSSIREEELRAWTEEGAVDYLGHIENMEEVLRLATLVTLPSYREGTPRILLEAAAMGKPIVATDVPGCREVTRPGVNGILVPPRNPLELAEAIERLLSRPDLQAAYSQGSVAVAQEFCESRVLTETADLYRKIGLASSATRSAPSTV